MKAALFEVKSWIGAQRYLIRAASVEGLIDGLEEYQSLNCLLYSSEEKDMPELLKLEHILDEAQCGELSLSELAGMNVRLSVGAIRCLGVADDGDDAALERLETMKKKG